MANFSKPFVDDSQSLLVTPEINKISLHSKINRYLCQRKVQDIWQILTTKQWMTFGICELTAVSAVSL
jgi:hypothetical protein